MNGDIIIIVVLTSYFVPIHGPLTPKFVKCALCQREEGGGIIKLMST